MGTYGLWKYVDSHNVQFLLKDRFSPRSPQPEQGGENGAMRNGTKAKKSRGVDHLFLDMNAIMHIAYDRQNSTRKGTIDRVLLILRKVLHLVMPNESLFIAFDGSAPLAKLATQRERRRKEFADVTRHVQLKEAEIVTGGAFVLECEEAVKRFFLEELQVKERSSKTSGHISASGGGGEEVVKKRQKQPRGETADGTVQENHDEEDGVEDVGSSSCSIIPSIRFSGCRTIGEGEAKIAEEIRRIATRQQQQHCLTAQPVVAGSTAAHGVGEEEGEEERSMGRTNDASGQEQPKEEGSVTAASSSASYTGQDVMCMVGTDSDLILVGVAAVPYHNLFLLNPYSFIMTDIGELMTHWLKSPGAHGMVNMTLLPDYRRDFVFIMSLAGGDHYHGVEDEALVIWRKYRSLRLDGGFYRKPLLSWSSVSSSGGGNTESGDDLGNVAAIVSSGHTAAATSRGGDDAGDYHLNIELLSQACSRDKGAGRHKYAHSKNKKGGGQHQAAGLSSSSSPEAGMSCLRGALWTFTTFLEGTCPNYHFMCSGIPGESTGGRQQKNRNSPPKSSSLRAAVQRLNPTATGSVRVSGSGKPLLPRCDEMPLPPLYIYTGVVTTSNSCFTHGGSGSGNHRNSDGLRYFPAPVRELLMKEEEHQCRKEEGAKRKGKKSDHGQQQLADGSTLTTCNSSGGDGASSIQTSDTNYRKLLTTKGGSERIVYHLKRIFDRLLQQPTASSDGFVLTEEFTKQEKELLTFCPPEDLVINHRPAAADVGGGEGGGRNHTPLTQEQTKMMVNRIQKGEFMKKMKMKASSLVDSSNNLPLHVDPTAAMDGVNESSETTDAAIPVGEGGNIRSAPAGSKHPVAAEEDEVLINYAAFKYPSHVKALGFVVPTTGKVLSFPVVHHQHHRGK